MAHQEIEITFNGQPNQVMHLGPLELKGGETKYLSVKNNIASFKQLSEIKQLSVRKVTVADKDDKVEEFGKDVVVKPKPSRKIVIRYKGGDPTKSIYGIPIQFRRGEIYRELTKDQSEFLLNSYSDMFEQIEE